jgi:acyl carrier protein
MTLAVLGDLIGDELGCGPVALQADTILADLPGWDSVAMAGVMLALEDRFGVMLERTSVDGVNTACAGEDRGRRYSGRRRLTIRRGPLSPVVSSSGVPAGISARCRRERSFRWLF